MGIIAEFSLDTIGLDLPTAYIALATNPIVLNPLGNGTFVATTSYGIWTSHDARVSNKVPVHYVSLTATINSLASTYTQLYDVIKTHFASYVDDPTHIVQPTDPTDPTEPQTDPTEPPTETPIEQPIEQPTESPTDPTQPPTEPTEPPSETPIEQPTEPTTEPTGV